MSSKDGEVSVVWEDWRGLLIGTRPCVRTEKTEGFGRAKMKEKRTNGAYARNMVLCACVYVCVYFAGTLVRRPEST